MKELKLEKMSSDDLDEVLELERELFQKEAWSRAIFEEDLAANYAKYWVLRVPQENDASSDYALAGYAGAYFILPDVEIANVAIATRYQGRGWSHKLMEQILSQAVKLDGESIFFEVDTQNRPAIGLYERYGFQKIAIRKNYYAAGRDAFVMKLELRGDM